MQEANPKVLALFLFLNLSKSLFWPKVYFYQISTVFPFPKRERTTSFSTIYTCIGAFIRIR